MNLELIKLFSRALPNEPLLDVTVVNAEAMQRGYLVHPSVCNQSVLDFVKQQTINYNATFYRRWTDVTEKSRLELLIDQLLHYFSTYGTYFAFGNGYVPNEGADVIPYGEYKTILPISSEELAEKCLDILVSGIALKQSTMVACADFLITEKLPFDIDSIKNREAQIYLCDRLGKTPTEANALFRYIIYKTTGSTLLIKNKQLCDSIMMSENPFDLRRLGSEQLLSLSSVFLRYKPLFLAFKKHKTFDKVTRQFNLAATANAPVINRLRKLAVRNHRPMPRQFWANILHDLTDLGTIRDRLPELTLFKVVSLMQLCRQRLLETDPQLSDRLYVIRNQKLFLQQRDTSVSSLQRQYLTDLYELLETYLVDSLRLKACVTRFPVDYRLTLPASEKSFVGNMPFGTSYLLDEHNYIGIYWREEWGTRDFDLSVVDQSGRKFGWNADYYAHNDDGKPVIVFSGDMTSANPEASEVFYFTHGCACAVVYVNRYHGEMGSKYRLYVGKQKIADLQRNYMVDPNSICLNVDMESTTDRQQPVGLIFDNRLTLMEFTMGNSRVSFANQRFLEAMKRKAMSFIDLETVLRKAGFRSPQTVLQPDGSMTEESPQLDLTNLDRATLIQLLS